MSLEFNCQIYHKTKNTLGEGLYVCLKGVYWLDIVNRKLFELFPDKISNEYFLPEQASVIFKIEQNIVYLASESGICAFDLVSKQWEILARMPKIDASVVMRANDGCMISDDYYFFGTMQKNPTGEFGSLYIAKGNEITKVFSSIGIPNSFIQIDKYSVLVSDSLSKIIYLFTFDNSFTRLINKIVWLDLSGESYAPDGGCMDVEGNIYIAMWDGFSVNKYDQNANLISSFKLPVPKPTNCKISLDKKSLFLTSARECLSAKELSLYPNSGSVFQIRLK